MAPMVVAPSATSGSSVLRRSMLFLLAGATAVLVYPFWAGVYWRAICIAVWRPLLGLLTKGLHVCWRLGADGG